MKAAFVLQKGADGSGRLMCVFVVVKKEALCPPVKSFDEQAEEVEDERMPPEPTNPLEEFADEMSDSTAQVKEVPGSEFWVQRQTDQLEGSPTESAEDGRS